MYFASTTISRVAAEFAVVSVLLLAAAQPAQTQTETVLYSFCPGGIACTDGATPRAGLIMDKEGNLYGTTWWGGSNYYYGTVFKLTPSGTETVVYSFCSQGGCADGYNPSADLILDKEGNLYGTTEVGGPSSGGTVFKLAPSGTETVLYGFGSQSEEFYYPYAGLITDEMGNLYGTTSEGGASTNCLNGCGTVFKLTPSGTETVLHSFGNQSGDGYYPIGGLIMDKLGNLYGTTSVGGAFGGGTVFEVTSTGQEIVLHSFGSQSGDGAYPYAGLIMDKLGNLYGTTVNGGAKNYGTVVELSPTGTETVLYSFTGGDKNGKHPYAGLIMDKKGNLYGASLDGHGHTRGAVFELSPKKKARAWTFTSLHAFDSRSGDGDAAIGTLVLDKEGNLYGTTAYGGAYGYGTVFKVAP
jgi:uncharacterized repeat protein (TIGR03803 family)